MLSSLSRTTDELSINLFLTYNSKLTWVKPSLTLKFKRRKQQ